MKNAETADQCKYIHDVGWMSGHGDAGYTYTRAWTFIGWGWLSRRRLDATRTAHNSLFGSSLQFKKAFVSVLYPEP